MQIMSAAAAAAVIAAAVIAVDDDDLDDDINNLADDHQGDDGDGQSQRSPVRGGERSIKPEAVIEMTESSRGLERHRCTSGYIARHSFQGSSSFPPFLLSSPLLSYPILSYPILSYPILSYPILSRAVILSLQQDLSRISSKEETTRQQVATRSKRVAGFCCYRFVNDVDVDDDYDDDDYPVQGDKIVVFDDQTVNEIDVEQDWDQTFEVLDQSSLLKTDVDVDLERTRRGGIREVGSAEKISLL
eukprot:764909-Hanusia_phi.AAC.2